MSTTLAHLLARQGEPLKADWVRRLSRGVPSTPLASADILGFRMDDTLRAVAQMLEDPRLEEWPSRCPPLAELRAGCTCGLNPLLDYFVLGGEALGEAVHDLSPHQQLRLNQVWHVVAQREIALLCSICQRRRRPLDAAPGPATT